MSRRRLRWRGCFTEAVFNRPGIGLYPVERIEVRDFQAVQSAVGMFTLLVAAIGLAVDVVYGVLDPRVEYRRARPLTPRRYPAPMPLPSDPIALVAAAIDGDRRALARVVSIVEDGRGAAGPMLATAYPASGGAYRIGITGAPGAGKSTLTDGLIGAIRRSGDQVAVLAVDPTSPFSGGAVLGDRVRMQDHVSDDGVYIRSMASRGHLGGLSAAAPKALALLDAAGFPWLLIETVGVGQDEVEITEAADTTIVVVTPGWGDGIQAAKAGILEIGDVFVVNKADRPGLRDTVSDLKTMLQLGGERPWSPPIVETVAAEGKGIEGVLEAVDAHRSHLEETGGLEEGRRRRRIGELEGALASEYRRTAAAAVEDASGEDLVEAVARGEADPWSTALRMLGTGGAPAR